MQIGLCLLRTGQKIKWLVQCYAIAFFASSAHAASVNVLVLGDSLSAEHGLQRGSGWVALMQGRLIADKLDVGVVNASISGETAFGGAKRLPQLLAKHRPALVIIQLGVNDGFRGLPVASIEANLMTMIQATQKSGARVLLAGMRLPPKYDKDYATAFAALFPRVAQEHSVGLVPFILEGVAGKPELFQADRLHPTAEAQPLILNNVWPHLKPLLK